MVYRRYNFLIPLAALFFTSFHIMIMRSHDMLPQGVARSVPPASITGCSCKTCNYGG
ncbi:hypothetical protein D1BOALGB6SA_281 [Olavius sp. associated proteobacterium Delta 1]|nr:hypothetical protein D1BOALGB6SA_281 [Olavius sp. associated proteobacterium Delta 1]